MAYAATSTHAGTGIRGLLTATGAGIFNALARMAERDPRVRAINALSATSDEQLAARGLTREQVIRKIFAGYMHL